MNKKQKTSSGQSVDLMEAGAHFDSRLATAIGKFIIEAGLGQDVLNLTSFKKMLQVASNKDQVAIPTYESILQEELKQTEHRAIELKEEWKKSGFSLIMDSWKSQCGKRSFVSASVHCSKGMYFLRSIDVSGITEDMDELVLVFARVVDDVGARNIVQVITNDPSPHMRMAWHYVQKKHDHSFFAPLCADFCINLLLEKIAALEHVSEVIKKAKEITRHIRGIVKTDDVFWCAAADVLKVTKPIVDVLFKLEFEDCPMGVLYDAMDSAKEEIKRNLGDNHGPYWDLVDRIWDSYLHSPLHVAGHLLNPRVFYKDPSHDDPEVRSGIEACVTGMAKGRYDPGKLEAQIEVYKGKSGTFGSDSASQQIVEIPQVDWWAAHGTGTPELQSFATRVLSQTCFGTERYNMNWQVSEEVHETRPYIIQELYRGLEYAHYNNCFASAVPFICGLSGDQFDKLGRQLGSDWLGYPPHTEDIVIET
ncbi:hypothetical protein D1007_22105 [Hordeum vulgare]|nr:hypothetical protein D1007_22105 [Hordeum vulgare]